MANPEHVEILKKGVEEWNAWREKAPEVRADLIEAELLKANLKGIKLKEANLFGEDLKEGELIPVNLFKASLSGADLVETNLSGAELFWADLDKANLRGANLRMANLSGADLSGADLRGAKLSKANLFMAELSKTNLFHAELHGANLMAADLTAADLMLANLTEAKLNKTDLFAANLNGADLRGADFSEAEIGLTTFADVDLSEVTGLDTVFHIGPSSIGIDTIYKSKGKIPEVFLCKAGVPDTLIKNIPSLIAAQTPIQRYSCFISHSHKDHEFAERLYNDLQGKGVRCWFAPEDMKIGDKIRSRIDASIRTSDKLLLILSKDSIASDWVETEVETAFEKERKAKTKSEKHVLFPIRLDESIMRTRKPWAADIRRIRHIGDFRNWKNHDKYKKAFDRLLRDLAAE